MGLKINSKYILRFNLNGKILTYTGVILSVDNMFVQFKDKFNDILNYNLNTLSSYEEVQ